MSAGPRVTRRDFIGGHPLALALRATQSFMLGCPVRALSGPGPCPLRPIPASNEPERAIEAGIVACRAIAGVACPWVVGFGQRRVGRQTAGTPVRSRVSADSLVNAAHGITTETPGRLQSVHPADAGPAGPDSLCSWLARAWLAGVTDSC